MIRFKFIFPTRNGAEPHNLANCLFIKALGFLSKSASAVSAQTDNLIYDQIPRLFYLKRPCFPLCGNANKPKPSSAPQTDSCTGVSHAPPRTHHCDKGVFTDFYLCLAEASPLENSQLTKAQERKCAKKQAPAHKNLYKNVQIRAEVCMNLYKSVRKSIQFCTKVFKFLIIGTFLRHFLYLSHFFSLLLPLQKIT